jgi:acyl-CoA thioesterase FadM
MHTDSNQHVNSLVYPRLFEEAVMRRLFALGRSRAVLARSLVIGWRRPSFAGDVLKVDLRLFETSATGLVAVGMFFGETETAKGPDRDRARCYVRLDLAP